MLIVFSVYTVWDWQSYMTAYERGQSEQAYICRIVMLCFVGYFVTIQVIYFVTLGPKKYLRNYWNIIEMYSYALIVTGEILAKRNREENYLNMQNISNERNVEIILIDYRVRIFYSLAALNLWLKSLYFFRMFRTTGYFIRIMMEVCVDLGSFIFIFFVVIVAFACAFLVIERSNTGGAVLPDFWVSVQDSY